MICRRQVVGCALLGTLCVLQSAHSAPSREDSRLALNAALPQHRLVGKGRLTVWGVKVYDAWLWAMPGFRPENLADQPFALELAYLRDFTSKDIAERSLAEMRRTAPISEQQGQVWMDELLRVIPNVKKGDRLIGIHRPGTGAQLLVNGKVSGEIRDVEFAQLFFGIWLSPRTSEPKVRAALLVGAY